MDNEMPHGTQPGSIGANVQNFKSVTARRINAYRGTPGAPLWQRNYSESILRSEDARNRVRAYILINPSRAPFTPPSGQPRR